MRSPWPAPRQDLLLTAGLAPPAQGLVAWHDWRAEHPGRDPDWVELQLLPAVFRNLEALPDVEDRALLRTVYRQRWAHNRARLTAATNAAADAGLLEYAPVVIGPAATLLDPAADAGVLPVDRVDLWFDDAAGAEAAADRLRAAGAALGQPRRTPLGRLRTVDLGQAHLQLHWSDAAGGVGAGIARRAMIPPGGERFALAGPVDRVVLALMFGLHRHAAPVRWLVEVGVNALVAPALDGARLRDVALAGGQLEAARLSLRHLQIRAGVSLPRGLLAGLENPPPADRAKLVFNALVGRRRAVLEAPIPGATTELLLAIASPAGRRKESRIDALRARTELDWAEALRTVDANGLAPLLTAGLESAPGHLPVPGALLVPLRDQRRRDARRNLSMTAVLLLAAAGMRSRGIPFAAYKGPVLALQAYGNMKLRTYSDLDVATTAAALPAALAALAEMGFERHEPTTAAGDRVLMRSDHHVQFHDQDGQVLLELHWEPLPRSLGLDFSGSGLWSRTVEVYLGAGAVTTFGAEDTLLVLWAHGAKHRWRRLEWLAAAARLTEGPVDWELIAALTARLHMRRMTALGLLLARDLLGASLPPEAQALTRDEGAGALANAIVRHGWERPSEEVSRFDRENLSLHERPLDRVVHLARVAGTPTYLDAEAVPLPPALDFAYWLVRPARLAAAALGASRAAS